MATTSSTKSISHICDVCKNIYRYEDGPLMLPCLHSFCKPCLEEQLTREMTETSSDGGQQHTAGKFPCPTCNHPTSTDIDKFPINLRLAHIARAKICEKRLEEGRVDCEMCEGTPNEATKFYTNRSQFFCNNCMKTFLRFHDSSDQCKFVDLSSSKEGGLSISFPPSKCSAHSNHNLELFCVSCNKLICCVCSQTDHSNHDKQSTEAVTKKIKANLHELLENVNDALSKIDDTLELIQCSQKSVKVTTAKVFQTINEACDKLIKAIENKRKALKEACQKIAMGKYEVLSKQITELKSMKDDLGYARAHAVDAIDKQSSEEVLNVEGSITRCLLKSMKYYQTQSMEKKEDGAFMVAIAVDKVLKEIAALGTFPGIPDHAHCVIDEKSIVEPYVGEEVKLKVIVKDESGNPAKPYLQHQLSMVGEDPDEYIPPKVTITREFGVATLGFTPDQPGEYELTIMVRNIPIAGPYKIVTKKTTELHTNYDQIRETCTCPVRDQCCGIAINDKGSLYLTATSQRVVKVYEKGSNNLSREFGGMSFFTGPMLSEPHGVCLIEDKVYVSNRGSHSIQIYTNEEKPFKAFGRNGKETAQFSRPSGICRDKNNRLVVADCDNERIQIFKPDGVFVKHFTCSYSPYDVAIDQFGYIHIAYKNSDRISVYSEDGKEIDSYGFNKLSHPCVISINSEGYRVIGSANNRLCIVDPSGKLIVSKPVKNCIKAVAIDDKGLVYVATGDMSIVTVCEPTVETVIVDNYKKSLKSESLNQL